MRTAVLASALLLIAPLTFAQSGFQTHTYSAPDDRHLIAQDLTRDGKPDLVLFGGPLNVKLNNGSGGFGATMSVAGASADFAAIADFNKDGLPDIATCKQSTTNSTSTLAIFLNHGGGSFSKSYSASIAYRCSNVLAGDVNRDGKADVVIPASVYNSTAQAYNSYLLTYFGDGTGKLGAPVKQLVSVAAQQQPDQINLCSLGNAVGANFSGTGRFDLILLGDCQAGPTNGGTIYYATSSTNGHYTLREIMEDVRQWDYNLPYIQDVDSTGRPDVVLVGYQVGPHGSWDSQLDFLVNQGGGAFALKRIFDENSYAASYDNTVFSGAAGRFNGDNIDDAVAGFTQSPSDCCVPDTPGIVVLNGQGHFTYTEAQRWKLGGYPYATITADFNRDGRTDIATLTHNNSTNANALIVYLQQSTSTSCAAPASPGVHVCSPVAGGTYSSPVTLSATGKGASGTVNHLELWVDAKKVASYPGATVNTKVAIGSGSHKLVVVEVDSKGAYIKSNPVTITVK